MKRRAFEDFLEWNECIQETVYPFVDRPVAVYLNMDEQTIDALAPRLGIEPGEFDTELVRIVRGVLRTDLGAANQFVSIRGALTQWRAALRRGDDEDPAAPPVLPLLSLLSLTGSNMHRDAAMSDTNFYGRLNESLGRKPTDKGLIFSYRRDGSLFWTALNDWIDHYGGLRGIPTAYALGGHRHVGLPLSQALMRSADRDRLEAFFVKFALPPHAQLPPGEIRPLLDLWLASPSSSMTTHLRRVWGSSENARETITEAVVAALASWDGSTKDLSGHGGTTARSKVVLVLDAGGFPKKRFRLGINLYAPQASVPRDASIVTGDEDIRVRLTPTANGTMSVGNDATFEAQSLLEGAFRLKDDLSGLVTARLPRRVVVFTQDPLSQRWVEADQVMLGEAARILVNADVATKVDEVLERVARPGWRALETFPQLPSGWVLYEGVEVFAQAPGLGDRMTDLAPLVPRTTQHFKLKDGFSLPGSTRATFHASAPPEISAVTDSPRGAAVSVYQDERDEEGNAVEELVWSAQTEDGVLVEPLAPLGLDEGAYRLEIAEGEGGRAVSSTRFALRTGDNPDQWSWRMAPTTGYDLSHPLGVLGVRPPEAEVDTVVHGAQVTQPARALEEKAVPRSAAWESAGPTDVARRAPLRIAKPDPDSCIYTGRHVEEIPQVQLDRRGRPVQDFVSGRCTGCGLERRYSTNYYRNRRIHDRKKRAAALAASIDQQVERIANLPEVDRETAAQWDLMLDGLFYTGGGQWSQFERIVGFVEPTALFADQAARSLEILGHVDIVRDPDTLRMTAWEVAPSTLVPTPAGFFMAGFWPDGNSDDLFTSGDGGVYEVNDLGPTSWYAVEVPGEREEHLAQDAATRLMSNLPALGDLTAALPRRPADAAASQVEVFDCATARWAPTDDAQRVGAYRLARFTKVDAVRTPADLDAGTQAASIVQLSKHIAAMLEGAPPLLSYSPATEELSVPRGADLPGLYGRAIALCSGRTPRVSGRRLIYPGVPADIAAHLAHLFTH